LGSQPQMDQRGQGQDPHSEQGLARDGRGGAMREHTKGQLWAKGTGVRGDPQRPPGRGGWKAFSRGGSRRPLPPDCPAHSGRGGEVEGRLSSAPFRPVPESRGRHLAPWQRQGRKRRGKTKALQAEPRSGTGWGWEPTGGSRAGLFCRVGDHFDGRRVLGEAGHDVDRSPEAPRAFWPKAEKGPRLQVLRASFG